MSVSEEIEDTEYIGMIRGIVFSIAMYIKYWGEHPWIDEIWRATGLNMEEIEKFCDEYDVNILKENQEYINRLQNKTK
jgi:hypothetical protein